MDICLNTVFLRILYFLKVVLNVLKFAVPAFLIIKVTIDVYKNLINPENNNLANIKNRLIAAIIVFLVPTIIQFTLSFFIKNQEEDYNIITTCYEFANLDYIRTIEAEKDRQELEEYLTEREKNLEEAKKLITAYRNMVKSYQVQEGVGEYANNKNTIKCGSGSQYNAGLFNAVRSAGYRTREGVVAAALYLSSHINVHIPYFWSGGHFHDYDGYKDTGNNFIGISDKWGCGVKMMEPGTGKQKPNQRYPFGMDCSGFVAWAIFNGGYYTGDQSQRIVISTTTPGSISGTDSSSEPQTISFSQAKGKVKPGDIVYKSGHVGMVVEVKNDRVLVAEERGADYGLVITEQKYGERFSHVVLMDNFYKNYKKGSPLYSGFK